MEEAHYWQWEPSASSILLPFFKSAREQPPPTFNPICIVLVTDGPFEDQNDTKTKSIKISEDQHVQLQTEGAKPISRTR